MKIIRLAWKFFSWFLMLSLILIGARCTQLGAMTMFSKDPTAQELEVSCKMSIAEGDYSMFTANERLNACLEDSYLSMGGAGIFGFVAAIAGIFTLLVGILWVRRALKSAAVKAKN